ncbi:MAG TPA: hypothetical protein VIF88_08215 [Methylocystis sp.]|jgi:hypothetical protein
MTATANATKLLIMARICRVSMALCFMRGARALGELSERLLPADLRREL